MPPSLNSSIPYSGEPSKTPLEELVIPLFFNFTEYQLHYDYLLADLPPASDYGILVARNKISLIIYVFPLAGYSRS